MWLMGEPNKMFRFLNVSDYHLFTTIMIQWWFKTSEQETVGWPKVLFNLKCIGFQGVVQGYLEVLATSAEVTGYAVSHH